MAISKKFPNFAREQENNKNKTTHMKKTLLLSALALAAAGAQAETFGDVFEVKIGHKDAITQVFTIEDKVYESGASIEIPYYLDAVKALHPEEIYESLWGTYNCGCEMVITNISDAPWQIGYSYVNISPTQEVLNAAPLSEYGFGVCYSFYNPTDAGSCIKVPNGEIIFVEEEIAPGRSLLIELHQDRFTNLAPLSFSVTAYLCADGEVYGDDDFKMTFDFSHKVDTTASVGAIGSDSSEAEYFNLQGVRVSSPEKGLFIKKQGGKASKVIL